MAWFITVEPIAPPGVLPPPSPTRHSTVYVALNCKLWCWSPQYYGQPGRPIDPLLGVPSEAKAKESLAILLTKFADELEDEGMPLSGLKIVFRENNLEPEAQDETNDEKEGPDLAHEDDLREKLKELAADALESCHFDKFGVRILSHSCDRCED